MSDQAELVALAQRAYLPIYRPRAIILERGAGSRVWDREGRDYVDFSAGIAVNAFGHADPDLVRALTEQSSRLWHTSNVFLSEPPVRLAAELIEAAGFAERVYLCNSGTEANEAAIKLARRYASTQGRAPERRVILTFAGSFHGRTLAAVTATAQPKYHEGFEPLPAGFRYAPFNDVDALTAAFDESVCAVLVEPIQGEGGVMPAAPGFLARLRELADAHGALLMLDEIQAGMGRTGKLFAHQWDGVAPDVVTLAKALGGGFPIGAMLVGARAAECMGFGAHGTTFGGNPLAAAVARVALAKLRDPALMERVARASGRLTTGLTTLGEKTGVFGAVRGRGLLLGAPLADAHRGQAGKILDHAAAHGLLMLQAGPDVLRFVPPLNIDDAALDDGLARLALALEDFARS